MLGENCIPVGSSVVIRMMSWQTMWPGCLQLLEILEMYWNLISLLEILEIY